MRSWAGRDVSRGKVGTADAGSRGEVGTADRPGSGRPSARSRSRGAGGRGELTARPGPCRAGPRRVPVRNPARPEALGAGRPLARVGLAGGQRVCGAEGAGLTRLLVVPGPTVFVSRCVLPPERLQVRRACVL